MKISCVIPAFERLDLLARCLQSALDQGDAVAEIIVTDDTRGTGVRDYLSARNDPSGLVRYAAGPRTGNPVDNWNRGLDLAQAEVRVLAHHDEWFLDRGFFGKALERFRDREVCAVIGGVAVRAVDRPSRFALGRGLATVLGRPRALLPLLNWIGPTAAFVFRGESHRFDPALQQLVDVDFYRRILGSDPAVLLPGIAVASLGHHPGQITARIAPLAAARRDLRVLRARRPAGIGPVGFGVIDSCLRVGQWIR